MAIIYEIHPENPQERLLKQAVALLERGQILALPTDSSFVLACHLDDKASADALRRIRGLDEKQHLSLLCRDLKELAAFAKVDNSQYRLIKMATPGPYTFILTASKEVPRRLSHPKRQTIGMRIPLHKTLQMLLEIHGSPVLATSLILPGQSHPLSSAEDINEEIGTALGGIVDAGACSQEQTTVLDLSGGAAEVLRVGLGDLAKLGL